MAKPATVLIKLVSTAGTGFFYTTKKNPRKTTEKLALAQVRSQGAQARRVQGSQDQIGIAACLWERARAMRGLSFAGRIAQEAILGTC